MQRVSILVTSCLLGAVLGSCSSSQSPSCELVAAPGGPKPRACIYEIPNGGESRMGDGGTIVVLLDGGVVATYPPCPCADASTP
jgi:hypothetical protein